MLGLLAGIVPFLIIISLIVTFHELGHFSVARLFNTRVERFSVGFGTILLRKTDRRGVEWCISALPLGGYVKFAGDENITSMMPSAEELDASRQAITEREGAAAVADYFHFKPLWQRFLIILAGPVANFVLAILVFTLVNLIVGEQQMRPTIGKIDPRSAAEAAGFKPGDTLLTIDGHPVASTEEAHMLIVLRADSKINIQVNRAGQTVTLQATPRRSVIDSDHKITGGALGIHFNGAITIRPLNPWEALVAGNKQTWDVLDTNLTYISRIFTGKENGDQIGGILGMTKATGDLTVEMAQVKAPLWVIAVNIFIKYASLMAMISIGVGFLNLLPVPMLDGGHLAFYAYQSVTKKPIPVGIQNAAFRIAVVLVLGLMLFAFWNDVNHIGLSTGLAKFFGGLFS